MTHLRSLDEANREFREWIELLRKRLVWRDDDKACSALVAVLHALRDGLPADEAVYLGSRLPLILRGAYYEGWRLKTQTPQIDSRADFLERIEAGLHHDLGIDPEKAAHAVFGLLAERLPGTDLESAKAATPTAMRGFWPD